MLLDSWKSVPANQHSDREPEFSSREVALCCPARSMIRNGSKIFPKRLLCFGADLADHHCLRLYLPTTSSRPAWPNGKLRPLSYACWLPLCWSLHRQPLAWLPSTEWSLNMGLAIAPIMIVLHIGSTRAERWPLPTAVMAIGCSLVPWHCMVRLFGRGFCLLSRLGFEHWLERKLSAVSWRATLVSGNSTCLRNCRSSHVIWNVIVHRRREIILLDLPH